MRPAQLTPENWSCFVDHYRHFPVSMRPAQLTPENPLDGEIPSRGSQARFNEAGAINAGKPLSSR